MKRREFLGASALPLLGCTFEVNDMPPALPFAPWHMWGTSSKIQCGNAVNTSAQLAKINYKRPETWSFWFGVQLLNAEAAAPGVIEVLVSFDLIIGVGRSMFDTQPPNQEVAVASSFAPFRIAATVPFVPSFNYRKWTTSGRGTPTDDLTATTVPRIDWLAAQDIQCYARARTFPTGTAVVLCTAFFAPRSHVRPDWFKDHEQFNGGEQT